MTWAVATWRDAGHGFMLDPDLTVGLGAGDPDKRLRELSLTFPRLAKLREDADQPVVSAFWEPNRREWTFVARGASGPYGAAGMVQLAMAPTTLSLHESWTQFFVALNREPWAVPERLASPPPTPLLELDVAAITDTVLLTLARPELGELPLDAGAFADVVAWVARILPEPILRSTTWSTLHASRYAEGSHAVAAAWPPAALEAWAAQRDLMFRPITPAELTVAPEVAKTVDWLVSSAAHGRFPARDSAATTSEALVAALRGQLPMTADEVQIAWRAGTWDLRLERALNDDLRLQAEVALDNPKLTLKRLGNLEDPHLPGQMMNRLLANAATHGLILARLVAEVQRGVGPCTNALRAAQLQNHVYLGQWAEEVIRNLAPDVPRGAVHVWLDALGLEPERFVALRPYSAAEAAGLARNRQFDDLRRATVASRRPGLAGEVRKALVDDPTTLGEVDASAFGDSAWPQGGSQLAPLVPTRGADRWLAAYIAGLGRQLPTTARIDRHGVAVVVLQALSLLGREPGPETSAALLCLQFPTQLPSEQPRRRGLARITRCGWTVITALTVALVFLILYLNLLMTKG